MKTQKFITFLDNIKTNENSKLVESVKSGFMTIMENDEPISTAPRQLMGYELIDNQTKKVLRKYGPDKRRFASRAADKLDLQYGAIRYSVRPIYK